jgi:Glycosyl transferases group 1
VPVVVCGRNDALRARLTDAGHLYVFGWVDNVSELIRACDVVVQNAGGLSASEALASGVPVLTYRCLPGHGRKNAAVLDAEQTVPWIQSPPAVAGWSHSALRDVHRAVAAPRRVDSEHHEPQTRAAQLRQHCPQRDHRLRPVPATVVAEQDIAGPGAQQGALDRGGAG